MGQNLFTPDQLVVNEKYRQGYDGIKWVKYPEEVRQETTDRNLKELKDND